MAIKLTKEQFIERARKKHGNKYDYTNTIYINASAMIEIICPIHGSFMQRSGDHINAGCGCQKCDPTETLGTEKFIEKAIQKHGDRYDYSRSVYARTNIKLEISCKEHGSFMQEAGAHLKGQGCPKCINNTRSTSEQFAEKATKKHHGLYDYSLVEYVTKKIKVKIICPVHDVFEQRPQTHLAGHGCPICNNSKLENYLCNKLKELNVQYEQNKRYSDCRNVLPLPFDFYLPDLDILIECDGIHHHKPIEHFGGEERYEYQKINDGIKTEYCTLNKKKLYRVNYYKDIDTLLKKLYQYS